jgi:hypothetical protein
MVVSSWRYESVGTGGGWRPYETETTDDGAAVVLWRAIFRYQFLRNSRGQQKIRPAAAAQ